MDPVYQPPQDEPKKSWFTAHMLLGVVFLLATGAAIVFGMYYWQTIKQIPQIVDFPIHRDQTKVWKTYTNTEYGYEFKYPPNLDLTEKDNIVTVNHSIAYENSGDCDMEGGNEIYSRLNDFNISFQVSRNRQSLAYVDGQFEAGILAGPWAYQGAEGCGHSLYYFPFGDGTLIVTRDSIQALSRWSNTKDNQVILKVPGIISSQENEKLFKKILSTFKIIEEEVCIQVITPARNKITGEEKAFPTPCDVPEGWEIID